MFLGFCWRVQCCLVFVVTLGFFYNMGFCFGEILVGSGQWWRGGHGGGTVTEVEGRWRRKLGKKKKGKIYFIYVDILF